MIKQRTVAELIVELNIAYKNKLIAGFVEHTKITAGNFYPTITITFLQTTPDTVQLKLKEFIEQRYPQVRKTTFFSHGALHIEYSVT